jgi:uncharacterized glyoxalase superfamily protein PhnB
MVRLTMAVPIVPARDIATTTGWYHDTFGFEVVHVESDYGIVERDGVGIHFCGPSGIDPAESNTMLRLRVEGIDELYPECQTKGIIHPKGPLREQPWGAREFAVVDVDGNLITFFER